MGVIDFLLDQGIHLIAHALDKLFYARQSDAEIEGIANVIDAVQSGSQRFSFGLRIRNKGVVDIRNAPVSLLHGRACNVLNILTRRGRTRRGEGKAEDRKEKNALHFLLLFFVSGAPFAPTG